MKIGPAMGPISSGGVIFILQPRLRIFHDGFQFTQHLFIAKADWAHGFHSDWLV